MAGTVVAFQNSEGNPSSMAHSWRYGIIQDTKLSTDGKCRFCLISYTTRPGDILTTVNGKTELKAGRNAITHRKITDLIPLVIPNINEAEDTFKVAAEETEELEKHLQEHNDIIYRTQQDAAEHIGREAAPAVDTINTEAASIENNISSSRTQQDAAEHI